MKKIVASVLLLTCSFSANAALVTNGDFETGDLTGWTTVGFNQAYVTGSNEFFAYSNPGYGTLSQTIDTVIGATYQVEAQVRIDYAYPGHVFYISIDGDQVSDFIYSSYAFTTVTISFVATGLETDLGFNFVNQAAGGGWYADNISANLAPVPIPGAAWLFGSALLGLVGLKRDRGAIN